MEKLLNYKFDNFEDLYKVYDVFIADIYQGR